MGRWDDRPDDSSDDWRGWKGGKYDSRYSGTSKKYRNPYRKKQTKKIGIIVSLVVAVGFFGFLFSNGVFEINEKNLNESMQNLTKNLPSLPKDLPSLPKDLPSPQQSTEEYHVTVDVIENKLVTLLGNSKHSLSSTYLWQQLEGESVKLSSYTIDEPTFMAPEVADGKTKSLVFRKTVNDPRVGEFIDVITIIVNPVVKPVLPVLKKSNDELVQYALEKINEDRAEHNLKPVLLSSNTAAQIHAEDVLSHRTISHWLSNGEKPYMTFSRLGGTGDVSQNVGFSGFASIDECKRPNVICEKTDPIESIRKSQYSMMYDDASSDWGHRDNILRPHHTHVSLGIAYDDYTFAFVQNFEDNYLISDNPIIVSGNNVKINSNLKSGVIQNIGIFYDSLPTSDLYFQHRNDGSYGLGDSIAVVVSPPPPNSFYNQPSGYKLIEANRWSVGNNSVLIDFSLSSVLTKPGVYTIGVWVDEGGESFLITSYSIFYKG